MIGAHCLLALMKLLVFLVLLYIMSEDSFHLYKKRKLTEIKKPWITPSLLKLINKKCCLYKKWIKNKSKQNELVYKNYILKTNLLI